mgnify:CR=1 FL=1|jgi:hypothetical protein
MHELMMNCLYLLVICLSVMGSTAVILILIGMVKGIVGMVEDAVKARNHDEEND